MSPRKRAVLAVSLFALFLVFAYSPLLSAGLVAEDYAALLSAEGAPATSHGEPDAVVQEKPLERGSLLLSRRLWGLSPAGSAGGGAALCLRLENLALLVAAAIGLGVYARRLLLPWSGSEQAKAAARAAAVFFALHPLAIPAVAEVDSRGDLLGLALATWSAAAFLRGRQDRRYPVTVLALVLCILAGFASDVALGLPLLLSASELASSHRYRPLRVRLRTALTTLVIFGGGASLELVLDVVRAGTAGLPPGVQALRGLTTTAAASDQLQVAVEKLGLLVLPANPEVLGVAGWALAGALFLLAMQPALVAARNAPRLWGWLLFGWCLALAASELLHADVRVTPRELSLARALLPSAAVMAVGLALGATALSGPKRPYVAWVVAFGYASLAHANALPWREAARAASRMRGDLISTLEEFGRDARILVLDPPGPVGGVEPVGDALAWLVHPELEGLDAARDPGPPRVRGLTTAAFEALAREPEFDAMRESTAGGPLVVLDPPRVAAPGAGDGKPVRERWLVPAPAPSETPARWNATLQSPVIDIQSLDYGALVVTAPRSSEPETLRVVSWTTRSDSRGSHEGTWVDSGEVWTGVFDLGSSLAWLQSGAIRRMAFEEGTGSIVKADPQEDVPGLGAPPPGTRGADWVFPVPDAPLVTASAGRGRFVLGLLDLQTLHLCELPAAPTGGELVVPGAVAEAARGKAEALVWILEYRIDGRVVARTRGRQEQR